MTVLTKQFIQTLGIDLDDETFALFDEHFEETLSSRVIESILDILDEEQLHNFAAVGDQDEEAIHQWLITNVPDLNEIISEEVTILIAELAENSEQI
jgi:hypothetical protein